MSIHKKIHIYVSVIFIGFFHLDLTAQSKSGPADDYDKNSEYLDYSELKGPPNGQGGWVVLEPMNVIYSKERGKIYLVPYKYRRKKWGSAVSVGYSTFAPNNFESNTGAFGFSDIYDDKADTPLIEIQLNIKRNFSLGSIGLEIGAGFYSNGSDNELVDSKLEIIPLRLGLNYTLDTLFNFQYFSPYVSAGGYIFKYEEAQGTTSYNGTTQVAPYFTAGVQTTIDWLDWGSANRAYLDAGLETTLLFVEGRMYAASSAEADPNFETDFQASAGLRLEF